jgi:hypothetical protein
LIVEVGRVLPVALTVRQHAPPSGNVAPQLHHQDPPVAAVGPQASIVGLLEVEGPEASHPALAAGDGHVHVAEDHPVDLSPRHVQRTPLGAQVAHRVVQGRHGLLG